jgi:leader peptidase (prepilin peptidase)/N-methyltransferase
MLRIVLTMFAGLLGLAFGSFLNVCLTRWPAGESVVAPRSHCRNCAHTLAWWENVPLVSWIGLRGRCRSCGAWIGWRYPLVELAVGALWASALWRFPVNVLGPGLPHEALYDSLITTLGLMLFYWLLVALAVLDAESLWLPDWLTLPGAAAGFLISSFGVTAAIKLDSITSPGSFLFRYPHGEQWEVARARLLAIVISAGLILLIRWVYWLMRRREGMGLGDAKLMALLAAWLGLPGALLAFALGVVLGAVIAVIQLAVPSSRAEGERWSLGKLPLGTFLCIGGIVSSLWGQQILAAYYKLAGL